MLREIDTDCGAPDGGRGQLLDLAGEIFGKEVWSGESPSRPLSSVDVMRFLVRIERRFDVVVPDEELRNENFASLGTVLEMIHRNRTAKLEEQ
jgi:hypothetical protein